MSAAREPSKRYEVSLEKQAEALTEFSSFTQEAAELMLRSRPDVVNETTRVISEVCAKELQDYLRERDKDEEITGRSISRLASLHRASRQSSPPNLSPFPLGAASFFRGLTKGMGYVALIAASGVAAGLVGGFPWISRAGIYQGICIALGLAVIGFLCLWDREER
jgi:hypothetical protein